MRCAILAFVAGTWVLQREAALPSVQWLAVGAALLLAAALAGGRNARVASVLLVAAGVAAGYGWAAKRAECRLADALPVVLEGQDVEVEGVVSSLPQLLPGATRFAFDVERAVTPRAMVPHDISLTWYAESARAPDAPAPRVEAGDRWRFVVRLKRPRGLANPHAFDFEPWALERGIRATGYVRGKPAAMPLVPRAEGWPFTLHRWRGEIRARMLEELGDARLRGVLVALAIGDQDSIAADDWDVFWRTGVGHLMSISGLHITMLAALAFAIA